MTSFIIAAGIIQFNTLQWRHNKRDGVSNHQPHDCFSSFIQTQIKENMKFPRHWLLCGEFTGDLWIPRTKGQYRGKCFHLMTSSWFPATINLLCKEGGRVTPCPPCELLSPYYYDTVAHWCRNEQTALHPMNITDSLQTCFIVVNSFYNIQTPGSRNKCGMEKKTQQFTHLEISCRKLWLFRPKLSTSQFCNLTSDPQIRPVILII